MLFVWRTITALRYSQPKIADIIENTLAALRLAWRPTIAISIPFGMAFAFNFDSTLALIGAQSFAGGSIGPSTLIVQGPLLAALVTAGVVGAAFAADLGARKVRDEIAGMEVISVNPLPRLVIPRVIACTVSVPVMYILGSAAFLLGGYVLLVVFRGSNAGVFLNGFQTLIKVQDVYLSLAKSATFGLLVGVTACYFGFQAEGGPSGVASKVRKSIIAGLVLVFLAQFAFESLSSGSGI